MQYHIQALLYSLGGLGLVWAAGKLYKRHAISQFTILNDLPALGTSRQDGSKLRDTVIICGGSIAGLLAARVCTDHFRRVIIIDPEHSVLLGGADSPHNPPSHTRVMQYKMVHSTQALYVGIMRRLFGSAYLEAVQATNCIVGPASYNIHVGNVYISTPLDNWHEAAQTAVGISRAAQETILRGLVMREAKEKGIEFISGTVLGFDVDPKDSRRLTGIKYRPTDDLKGVISLGGDLILDCSGNARAGLNILRRTAKLPASIVESYDPHMRYSSCTFPNAAAAFKPMRESAGPGYNLDSPFPAFFVPAPGQDTRWIGMVLTEGDHCKFLAGGPGFEGKIESAAELRDLAMSIHGLRPMPAWFLSVLDNFVEQESTSERPTYDHAAISPMTLVKYHEHADLLPINFIAMGDAWMRLNPINGQGLAKAGLEATTLDATLRSSSSLNVSASFYRRLAPRVLRAWSSQKNSDAKLETTEPVQLPGSPPSMVDNLMTAFTKGVGRRMLSGDRDIASRVMGISAWVRPPTDLMVPSVLGKVMLDKLLGKF